jgi:hypothetical protein
MMSTRRVGPARHSRAHLAIAGVLALVLLPCAALARPLSHQESTALAAAVESFGAAMREGNFTRVAQTVPPKIVGAIARRAGTTPDRIVASMIEAMQTLHGGDTRIESFGMDLVAASHKELASGEPYVLIPTQTTIALGGQRFRERSYTLALLDAGKWFLLRINNARQIEILREVYPEFTSVEFPSGATETLNP